MFCHFLCSFIFHGIQHRYFLYIFLWETRGELVDCRCGWMELGLWIQVGLIGNFGERGNWSFHSRPFLFIFFINNQELYKLQKQNFQPHEPNQAYSPDIPRFQKKTNHKLKPNQNNFLVLLFVYLPSMAHACMCAMFTHELK